MPQKLLAIARELAVLGQRDVEQPEGGITLPQRGGVALIACQPDDEHNEREERDRHQRQETEPERRDGPPAQIGVIGRYSHSL